MIFSFAGNHKKLVRAFTLLGLLAGCAVFGLRVYDPRGMNLALIAFNRYLVITIAALALVTLLIIFISRVNIFALSLLILVSLIYLVPPVLQYTREFIYFGEAGISTNAMLRALGFTLGLCVCLLLSLSSCEVHKSLNTNREKFIFLFLSLDFFCIF